MKNKTMNVVGVGCGALCAVCVLLYIGSVHAEIEQSRSEVLARYGGEQVEVCVASRDIAPGDEVNAGDITTKLWVTDLLPSGAIKQSDSVIGKTASSSILKGEVLLEQRFQKNELSLEVPSGFTALSVPAKNVQAVGGALMVGTQVDVYGTANASTSRLISKVTVLATNMSLNQGSGSGDAGVLLGSGSNIQWITLAVPPQYVEQVIAAAQQSELYFTLPS